MRVHLLNLRTSPYKWKRSNILSQIFNTTPPEIKEWTDPNEIISILEILAGSDPSHCAFLPGGGHIHLKDVEMNLSGYIDLKDCILHRVNAKSLTFMNLSELGYYFLLESNESKPSGLIKNTLKGAIAETVAEVEPGEFIDRKFHDFHDSYEHNFGDYQEQYPVRPHLVKRYLNRNSIIMLANENPNRYHLALCDGLHNRLSNEELKQLMLSLLTNI